MKCVIFDIERLGNKVTPNKVRQIIENKLWYIEEDINAQIIIGFHWLFARLEGDFETYFLAQHGRYGLCLLPVKDYPDIDHNSPIIPLVEPFTDYEGEK